MGSLQEQLLKAGLVSKQKAKQARSDRRKKRRKGEGDDEVDLARAYAERARIEQRERDRALNRQREAERLRRERNAKLKQLITPNLQNDPKGELARFFEHKGKIRKIYVNPAQQRDLNEAKLGIVYLRGRYFLVAAAVVERVRALSDDAVAFYAPLVEDAGQDFEDDAYADERFQVPDDLQW